MTPDKKTTQPEPATERTLEVPALNPALESAARDDDAMLTASLPPTAQSIDDLLAKKKKKADDPPPPTLETPALTDNPALKSLTRRKKPQ